MIHPDTAPPPPGVTADFDHPQDALRTINYVIQAVTFVLTTGFMTTRIYAKRRVLGGAFLFDDYATYLAYFLLLAYCIVATIASYYGGGLNHWEVRPEHLQSFFKCCYAATIIYMPMTLSIKLALLLLITRVFGTVHRKTLMGIYCLLGMLTIYYISGLFIKIFVCWPISAYWHGQAHKCLNHAAIIISDAIVSVMSDLAILLLPVPLTWSLQLPRRQRLRVIGLLCAGGIATGFSVYRLVLILEQRKSRNQTFVFTKIILSGDAEVGIGLICACLPSINSLCMQRKNGSSYFQQHRKSRRTASRTGDIILTRSYHVDTTSLTNYETRSVEQEVMELESRQDSQSNLRKSGDVTVSAS